MNQNQNFNENKVERLDSSSRTGPPSPREGLASQPTVPEEEKLEFLKRGEIRTMQKDIAKLREAEARKERERIAELKPEEKPQKEKGWIPSIPAKEKKEEKPVTLIPRALPKKLSPLQKILIRVAVIAVILFIGGFFYWFFAVRPVEVPPEELIPAEEIPERPEIEITIPSALIAVNATQTLEVASLEEISLTLSRFLAEKIYTEGFIRILIKNTIEKKILSLEEFFKAFEIKTPGGLLEKFDNDFTLFVYSNKETNRLGFITKVKEREGLLNLLKSWEKTMETDTDNLFVYLGKEGPALSPLFKTAFHQNIGFRFLTISRTDFGICYAWFDDYFVFTTSFESMKRTIEGMKTKETEEKIGQLFIIGFEGKTVTPQLEEIFRKYRPGGVLLLSENIESEEQLKKLTQDLQTLSFKETGLPLFIAVDQEGGLISRIGFASERTPQSEITDIEQAYQIGKRRGEELKALGINLNLAPVLDIVKEDDFIFSRTFQKTLEETANLGESLILGQKVAGILTAMKHFPGYGGITSNPEEKLMELETIPEIDQFKIAKAANPEFIMTSNVIYKNIDSSLPFTFSPSAIQFLKNNLGSEILIISDDLAQNYLLENFSLNEIVAKPIQAGVDLLIFSGWEIEVSNGLSAFFEAFQKGEISQAKINSAISKIIQLKQNL